MKIAYLISLDNSSRSGLYYSIISKISSFKANHPKVEVKVFNMDVKQPYLVRKSLEILKINKKRKFPRFIQFDGLECEVLYFNYSLFSYMKMKFSKGFDFYKEYASNNLKIFNKYDLISAHYTGPGLVVYNLSLISNIKYTVTFHGTDINVTPFQYKKNLLLMSKILERSSANFFVSETLLKTADYINSDLKNNFVLYNGIDFNKFSKSSRTRIRKLKEELNIKGKVVGFVGNLVDVKNVLLLPEIFNKIKKKCDDISFVVIGDGILSSELKNKFNNFDIEISYFGRVKRDNIIDYYSIMDVLVLPSKNEGLPLVLLEALACNVHCVGSNIGGIPEAIGTVNCSKLNNDFVANISHKIVDILSKDQMNKVDLSKFSLINVAKKEGKIYKSIMC